MTHSELNSLIDAIRLIREQSTDETALNAKAIFQKWRPDTVYDISGQDIRLLYEDRLYRVVQSHTSQENWTPDITPALYTEIALPGEYREIKENMLPTEAFALGEIGWWKSKGDLYKSLISNNTYTPVSYPDGWEAVDK